MIVAESRPVHCAPCTASIISPLPRDPWQTRARRRTGSSASAPATTAKLDALSAILTLMAVRGVSRRAYSAWVSMSLHDTPSTRCRCTTTIVPRRPRTKRARVHSPEAVDNAEQEDESPSGGTTSSLALYKSLSSGACNSHQTVSQPADFYLRSHTWQPPARCT